MTTLEHFKSAILEQFENGGFASTETPVGAVLYALVFGLLAWLAGWAVRLAIQRVLAYDKRALVDRTTVKFLGQVAQIGVYLFAFISYTHVVPALKGLGGAWLTGATVISAVIGLAAQSTLSNLIAGFSLVLYRPFKVGDRLHVTAPTGLETGEVESVNLGYTVLKTDDNRHIVIPNSVIATQITVNLTGDDPRVLCSVPVGIGCEADIDQARGILLDLARHDPKAQSVCGCPVTEVALPASSSRSAPGAPMPTTPSTSSPPCSKRPASDSARRASTCLSRARSS